MMSLETTLKGIMRAQANAYARVNHIPRPFPEPFFDSPEEIAERAVCQAEARADELEDIRLDCEADARREEQRRDAE